jgi:Tfp pilus assembly protein PilF
MGVPSAARRPPAGAGTHRRLSTVARTAFLLAVVTVAVYAPVVTFDFVNLDDNAYVTDNPWVRQGFSTAGLRTAFSAFHAANWHPVTWLSHMLDCELFSLHPGLHHLTNLLLHTANTVILFLLLAAATRATAAAAAVAALFALHPLHVESVAWVAERKDVLSTLFWLLTLAAYGRFVRARSWRWYLAVTVLLTLGLMAKPMLVTLPFTLLLLDVWPLARVARAGGNRPAATDDGTLWRVVVEKLPLLLLVAGSCVLTWLAQSRGDAVVSFDQHPLPVRCAHAVVAAVTYLGKTVWPASLAVYYPHPGAPAPAQVLGAAVVLAGLTAAALSQATRRPYLLVGWLWFLGTLVPVIGIVQVGAQALADRYTYVPLIGVFTAVVFLLRDLARQFNPLRRVLPWTAAVLLLGLGCLTVRQVLYWRNSEALYRHALSVTTRNSFAHYNLGGYYYGVGRYAEAAEQYQQALAIRPGHPNAHFNLGLTFLQMGRTDEALTNLRAELRYHPNHAEAHNKLGVFLYRRGDIETAIHHLAQAARLDPHDPVVRNNYGGALAAAGRSAEAMAQYLEALRLRPEYFHAHVNLAATLEHLGRTQEAVEHYRAALTWRPGEPTAAAGLQRLAGNREHQSALPRP